jgi:hypothetical protein
LLSESLVELSKGEHALAIVILTKKNIFGNWTKQRMCGDYLPINKRTHSNKYAIPLSEEIFDALGQAMVFSTLDLIFGYN